VLSRLIKDALAARYADKVPASWRLTTPAATPEPRSSTANNKLAQLQATGQFNDAQLQLVWATFGVVPPPAPQPLAAAGAVLTPANQQASSSGRSPMQMIDTNVFYGKVGPRRKRGFVRRSLGSSNRLTMADMTRPITTEAEQHLFYELYPMFTKGKRTAWDRMALEWNRRVVDSTNSHPPGTYTGLYLTTDTQLMKFEKQVVSQLAGRDTLALMQQGPTHVPALLPPPPLINMQGPASAFDVLMGRRSMRPAAQAVAPSHKRAGENTEGTGRGGKGVMQSCKACEVAGDGFVQLTQHHRATCPNFAKMHPQTASKAKTAMQNKEQPQSSKKQRV